MPSFRIRPFEPNDWLIFKEFRLQALKAAPGVFATSYAAADEPGSNRTIPNLGSMEFQMIRAALWWPSPITQTLAMPGSLWILAAIQKSTPAMQSAL